MYDLNVQSLLCPIMRLVLLEQEVGNRKHSYDPLCLKVVAICMNITDFSLIKYQPYFAVQIGGSCRSTDSTLKACCGIWHIDVS